MDLKKQTIDQIMAEMANVLNEQETQILNEALIRVLHGVVISKPETTLSCTDNSTERFLKLFVASRRLEGMSDCTISQYLFYSRQFFSYIRKDFHDITTVDVQFYLAEYERTHHICKRSLDNMRKGINGFFVWLKANDYIDSNPVERVRPIAFDKKPIEVLTEEEIVSIRDFVHGDYRTRAIVELLLAVGVRVSELCNIRISDVDFDKNEIVIQCAKKHQKQERTLFLTAEAKKALSDYLNYRYDRGWIDCSYLFVANRKGGKRITERLVNNKLRNIESSLNLQKKLTVHTFRKTLASILYKRGMQPLDIAYILGHADSRMSETYYISIKQEEVEQNYKKYR